MVQNERVTGRRVTVSEKVIVIIISDILHMKLKLLIPLLLSGAISVYGEGSDIGNNANRYTERISRYTANGSPVCIERYGRLDNGSYNRIDNLSLTYNGNQLKAVSDAAPAIHYNGAFDFRDGANLQTEYTYDGCGSLTSDANKGIAHIDYDLTGMPRRIQFTNGNVTEYVYNPTGEKLRTIHRTAVADLSVPMGSTMELTTATTLNTETADYIGNLILKNDKPDRYLFNGGYCSYPANPVASSQPTFHYYTKDHLGNNRTVVNENGTLEQVTHYYPFGGIFGDATLNAGIQPYKYNCKEFDRVHGLNTYDYGARQHDPILARWDRADGMAENKLWQSPYVYGRNNPIRFVDPDGKDDLDKVVGFAYGIITNLIPGTDFLRDGYTPNNTADYNSGLKSADKTTALVGTIMLLDGGKDVATGLGVASVGVVATAYTGGGTAPAAVISTGGGVAVAATGAAKMGVGAVILSNTSSNSSKGYNRGKLGSPKDAYNEYVKGRAPKGIDRIDKPKEGQIHAHQKGKGATNADGTTHDKGKGAPKWSNKVKKWLRDYGFNI
jgi:RHS repeat-associated protein